MMPVKRPREGVLRKATRNVLKKRQKKADAFSTSSPEIRNAWESFGKTDAKDDVASQLKAAFFGKCAYCEITVARDVEHFYPKSLFPNRMFRWDNFLFACQNCNGDKGNTFPMNGGTPLLLDPCSDDPADFITWDLELTGAPVETTDDRLESTLATVPQLRSDSLARLRLETAMNFQFFLTEVLEPAPRPPNVLRRLEDELDPRQQWMSVRRQILRDPNWQPVVTKVRKQYPHLGAKIDALLDPRSVP